MPDPPEWGSTARFTRDNPGRLVRDRSGPSVRRLTLRAAPVTLGRARYDAARSLATSNLNRRAAFSPRIFARESSVSLLIVRSMASAECGHVPS